jgi:hypothetical protein
MEKKYEVGRKIIIPGNESGKKLDPKILIQENAYPRYYLSGLLFNQITKEGEPFIYQNETNLLPITVSCPGYSFLDEESQACVFDLEKESFFQQRADLSPAALIWLVYSLINLSNNPSINNPPLLNKGEYATYLFSAKEVIMFQLVGSYGQKRGWNCASFALANLSREDKKTVLINKILIPI